MHDMVRGATTDTNIARIAGRQRGLVTKEQLDRAGVTRSQLRHRLDTGSLVRSGGLVYRHAAAPRTWDQRALAACLAEGKGAVLWGRSAAAVWRMDLPLPRVLDVAVPGRNGRRRCPPDVRVREVRSLAPEDCTHVGVLPVTTVGRTMIDLAGDLEASVLLRVLDAALAERLVTPERLDRAMDRIGGRGRRGFGELRSMLEPWRRAPELESVPEAAALRLFESCGLPAPSCQHVIVLAGGAVFRVDFAWPAHRTVLEVDGFRWHGGPRERDRDSRRANALAAEGWVVLRTTPAELRDAPGVVIDALLRHVR
jgi:hypothetical protein